MGIGVRQREGERKKTLAMMVAAMRVITKND